MKKLILTALMSVMLSTQAFAAAKASETYTAASAYEVLMDKIHHTDKNRNFIFMKAEDGLYYAF